MFRPVAVIHNGGYALMSAFPFLQEGLEREDKRGEWLQSVHVMF